MEAGTPPNTLIINYESTRETVWMYLGCLTFMFGIPAAALTLPGYAIGIVIVVGILAFVMRSRYHDYYEADFETQELYQVLTSNGRSQRNLVKKIADLETVRVTTRKSSDWQIKQKGLGVKMKRKGPVSREHGVQLVTKEGEVIQLISPGYEHPFSLKAAKEFAERAGLGYEYEP